MWGLGREKRFAFWCGGGAGGGVVPVRSILWQRDGEALGGSDGNMGGSGEGQHNTRGRKEAKQQRSKEDGEERPMLNLVLLCFFASLLLCDSLEGCSTSHLGVPLADAKRPHRRGISGRIEIPARLLEW